MIYILEQGSGLGYPPRTHRETLVASEDQSKLQEFAHSILNMTEFVNEIVSVDRWVVRGEELHQHVVVRYVHDDFTRTVWFIIRQLSVIGD